MDEPSQNLSLVIYIMSIIIIVSAGSTVATEITSVQRLLVEWSPAYRDGQKVLSISSSKCCWKYLGFLEITLSWFTYNCHCLSSVCFAGSFFLLLSSNLDILQVMSLSCCFCFLSFSVFSPMPLLPLPHTPVEVACKRCMQRIALEQGCMNSEGRMSRPVICMNNQSISPFGCSKTQSVEFLNGISEFVCNLCPWVRAPPVLQWCYCHKVEAGGGGGKGDYHLKFCDKRRGTGILWKAWHN